MQIGLQQLVVAIFGNQAAGDQINEQPPRVVVQRSQNTLRAVILHQFFKRPAILLPQGQWLDQGLCAQRSCST